MTTPTLTATANPYLDAYRAAAEHQRKHDPHFGVLGWREEQPSEMCTTCLLEGKPRDENGRHGVKRRYSWAIPNDAALITIQQHAPYGVVEIGAGGGYWAGLLRARGVDVVAYDPDPVGGVQLGDMRGWHDGTRWSEVLLGDHTAVTQHPDRALLLVWPSYDDPWTDEVLDLYAGDTVIYVGEGQGGCTGTDRMHAILGAEPYCWHDKGDDDCTCLTGDPARFDRIASADIPQWAGIHDRLNVYRRRPSPASQRTEQED